MAEGDTHLGTLILSGSLQVAGGSTGGSITIGEDDTGYDVKFFGATSGSYFLWDESVDTLLLIGATAKFRLGTFSGAVVGSGSALSATNTAAFRVYADDGGAAIGSGVLARAGVFRHLLTYTGGNREQEAAGVIGQVVSVAGTNRHNMAGTWGSYEARTSLVIDGQAAATDTWAQAAIIARVGVGSAIATLNTNGVLAGVAAMSNTASFAANNGDYAALYAGAWASAVDWDHGLLIESGKCVAGVTIKTTSGAGIDFPAGETYGKALAYGEFGTPVVFGDDEPFEIHGRLDADAKTKPLMRVRCSTPDGVAMTTGEVHAIQAQAYNTSTSDAAILEAIQGHVGIKANAEVIVDITTAPNMRAAWFKIEDLGFNLTLTGAAAVLALGMQFNSGTTLTGNADWIFLGKEGSLTDPADAFVRVYDGAGGGWANFLIDAPASLPWDAANSSNTQSGKIAVRIGGATKYIQTYSD